MSDKITFHHLEASRSLKVIVSCLRARILRAASVAEAASPSHRPSGRQKWLAEFLGVPYELITYSRDPNTKYAKDRDALVAVHPLGRSPVMTVDVAGGERLTVAEGGAIMTYLLEHYGKAGVPKLSDKTAAAQDLNFWIQFGESECAPY